MNEDVVEFETQCTSGACSGYKHANTGNKTYGTWYAVHNIGYANINLSGMLLPHLSENNNEIFYWILYPLMKKNQQGSSKISGINVSSTEELKSMIERPTLEQKTILQQYRIIIEPLYYFKEQNTGYVKFATIKAMARNSNYNTIDEFGGYYFITFAKNFFSSKQHGIINSAGHRNDFNHSASSGSDKYSGIGYMVISIISDDVVVTCDKSRQCCFDSTGNYHAEYSSENSNYKCLGSTSNNICPTNKLESCNPVSCDDTISRARCEGTNGTISSFHENDNIRDCTLNTNANSGFDLVKASETKVTINGVAKTYCQVSCKDDFDISLPTNKSGYAGQYFVLENYVPTIKIKRTCATTRIDYNAFKQDLASLEQSIRSGNSSSFTTYKNAIASFRKCFTWLENDTLNMKNLSVKFSYDNDTYNLFGAGKNLDKNNPQDIINTFYWNEQVEADNKYSNPNANEETEELELLNDVSGSKVKMKFYKNTYIKRTEEKTYTFTVPLLYSLIPSGKVVISKPNTSYELLATNAVPIGLATAPGQYNYSIVIDGVQSINRNNNNDTLNYRFTQNAMKNYVCKYGVKNDIYSPPGTCIGKNCSPADDGKLNFFYRPIDMSNINPNNRELGYNWKDYNEKETKKTCLSKECKVNESMKITDANYQELVNGDKDKFEFILTPGIMSDIRNYNIRETHSGGYSDWKLNCTSGGLHYYCKSNLLTCLASSGTQNEGSGFDTCSTIFSTHNMNGYAPTFDSTELLKNRNILMNKLEGFK